MSKRPESKPLALQGLPGLEEAKVIREALHSSKRGLRATVASGLLLAAAKERLPHGHFQEWIRQFLPDVSYRTANRNFTLAGHVWEEVLFQPIHESAAAIVKLAAAAAKSDKTAALPEKGGEVKSDSLSLLHGEPGKEPWRLLSVAAHALLAERPDKDEAIIVDILDGFLDGKNRQQLLLLSREDSTEGDDNEVDAKAQCEEIWEKDPAKRDEWEPRVLAGELKYGEALKGMRGQEFTAGKTRVDANYDRLLPRVATTLKTAFSIGAFEKMSPASQVTSIRVLSEWWHTLSPNLRSQIQKGTGK